MNDEFTFVEIINLNEKQKDEIFNLYYKTYKNENQKIWFNNKNELFKNYDVVISMNENYTKYCVLIKKISCFNKICVLCNSCESDTKKNCVILLLKLLQIKNYIIEASDKVSWILRKNNIPIIKDETVFKTLFPSTKYLINENQNFNYNDKYSYQYERTMLNHLDKYTSNYTLFGNISNS